MKSSWKRLWMLVSVLVLVGSLAGCGLFGDDDDNGEEEDPKTVTVYFYNSEGWDEVYAYSDDVEGMEDPGEEADEDSDADDWYMIEIERDVLRDPMDVVFHNNDGEEAETVTIDHPNQVYVTAKGDVFGSMGGVEDEMNATLYFYNSEEWDNVHVQSDDIDALSDNPEVDEDPDNEDWYSVTVPANLSDTPISVTFNDGDVSTGTELNLDDHSKTYLTVLEDGVYSSMDSAESAISGVSTTVYFYNTEEWDDVYAWAWTDDGDIFESWPGEAAEEVEDQDGWYSIDLPGIESTDSLEIIFNNNDGDDTIQTDDTPFASEDDLYVVFEGDGEVASTYESFDEAESASEQVTFDLWFYNDQGWDSVYADAEDDGGESVLDGAEATQDGDTDWWSIEVPADLEEVDVDVTFHDNDDSEGDTITIEDEDDYYLTSDKDVMYEGRTKVYFNNEDEWADVYADVETDEDTPESFLTDVEALQDGDSDWYFVDIPVNFSDDDYTITFHDGDDDEAPAAELTDNSDKYITMTEDETYSTLNQAEAWMDAASEDFVTVYYYNSEGWDLENINGYNWSTVDSLNEVLGAWPGMSVEEDPDDSDWVMIDVPLDFDDISGEDDTFTMIFNNGDGEQTPDIELTDENELYAAYDGNTYADKEAAEEAMEPEVTTQSLVFNGSDMDLGDYPDSETIYTIDGFDFAYEQLGNFSSNYEYENPEEVIQIKADDGLIYNQTAIPNIQEIIITFDDNQEYAPSNLTMYGGTSEKDDSNVIEDSNSDDFVMTYDFSDTDYEYFYYTNGQYAAYAVEIEIIYEDVAD